jgi:6-pyruvoyltetrahydropterin/6-carboxytetrahydropterin synthase
MKFVSTKTYGHDVGLSCAFRQWRADSHCRFLHGYALAFRFTFEATELDARNWVVDFGSLKSLKQTLQHTFDHKTVVAEDDPQLPWFEEAHRRGILDLVTVPAGGCEKFAELAFEVTDIWLRDNGYTPRVRLRSVEVSEHGANSAIVEAEKVDEKKFAELEAV